jgi:DNA-binding response OmpR family regulator
MARIIIADDDSLVGDIVRYTLEPHGHIVGVVGNGVDAVQVAETKRPDLIILDCAMPGLGGVEALRRIRGSRTAFATSVLMLTARGSSRDEEIAVRAGANDYLRKPFDPAELLVVVERLLTKSAAPARTIG